MKYTLIIFTILYFYSCGEINSAKKSTYLEFNLQRHFINIYKNPHKSISVFFDGFELTKSPPIMRDRGDCITFRYQQNLSGITNTIIEFQVPRPIIKSNFSINIDLVEYYYYKYCSECVQKDELKLNGTLTATLLRKDVWKITGVLKEIDSDRTYNFDKSFVRRTHSYSKVGNMHINELDEDGTKRGWHIEDYREAVGLTYYINNIPFSAYYLSYRNYGNKVQLKSLEVFRNPSGNLYSTEYPNEIRVIYVFGENYNFYIR